MESRREGTYQKSVTLTKSDETVFSKTAGIYVTGTGNLVVVYGDGSEDTWTAVPAKTLLPISIIQLKDATTATGVKALY